jgi:hypothetical protein
MRKEIFILVLLSTLIGMLCAGCSLKASVDGTFAPAYLTGGAKPSSQGGGNCGN